MMIYFGNPFKLPGPADLGMSDSNDAMPMRDFPPEDGSPTWEDYEERLKQLYPVKYFLSCTLPDWLYYSFMSLIGWKVRKAWRWIQYHTTHRYHVLDLRQPHYRHGYLPTDTRMLYAMFNLLCRFVEKKNYYLPTEEQAAQDPFMAGWRQTYLEAEALYHYWKVERPNQHQLAEEGLNHWHEMWSKDHSSELAKQLHKLLNQLETQHYQHEEEMVQRLVNIRRKLT